MFHSMRRLSGGGLCLLRARFSDWEIVVAEREGVGSKGVRVGRRKSSKSCDSTATCSLRSNTTSLRHYRRRALIGFEGGCTRLGVG